MELQADSEEVSCTRLLLFVSCQKKSITEEHLAEFQKRAELFLLKCEKGVAGIAKGLEDQSIESKS